MTAPIAPDDREAIPVDPADSERVAEAKVRIRQRHERRVGRFKPIMWTTLAVVVLSAFLSEPRPGIHGRSLAVAVALVAFAVPCAYVATRRALRTSVRSLVLPPVVAGASGVVLAGLQVNSVGTIPAAAAVMIAFMSLELVPALVIGTALTGGLGVVLWLNSPAPTAVVVGSVLICVVLAITAHYLKRSEFNADRAELLLAELQDAREAEAAAVALTERGRIARELHDVLAQSLSALSIQLEGARKIADREGVSPALTQLITRSSELTREGLEEARRAVGALRGDTPPIEEQLHKLVERCRTDLRLSIILSVDGEARRLSPEATAALYRGAQEALTNAARYAGGSPVEIVLSYAGECATLTVRDGGAAPGAAPGEWTGGGNGLRGMRERVERAGGSVRAGPAGHGWIVEMEVPS